MAILTDKGIRVDKVFTLTPSDIGISFTDYDGVSIFLSNDVVAHIVSMASHKTKIKDLEKLMDYLCSCPKLPKVCNAQNCSKFEFQSGMCKEHFNNYVNSPR